MHATKPHPRLGNARQGAPRRCPSLALSPGREPNSGVAFALLKWGIFIGLAALLLFAHGCHGNEDHELFTSLAAWL